MKLIDVLKYLGGKVIVDELAGEFASLAVLSQQVGIGVIVVQRVGSDLVVGCKDASIISGARFTESVVEPLTFEEWEDIPLDMDDRVSLIELPLPLVYLFLNIPIRQEDATVIAARLPLSLASQLVQSRCEDGNYWLGLEDGILLLMFGPQEHKAVWVGQFGIRTGEEAIDFALNTYGDEMVSILKVSLEPEEVRYERAQVLLDSARAVWSEEKDIDKALELAQQVVDVLPVQARTLTAQIYRMNGDYDKAVQELMPLMEQGIATEEVYGNLARLYEQQDKVLQAVKTLRTALEKDGIDTLQILRYLVALYTKRQMVTELIETLDEIISLCEGVEEDQAQETLHWALHRKGLAFMLKGDTRQSLVFLEKAVEIEPADVGPYQDLARAYRELGDTREAIAVLQRALEHLTDEDKIKAYNTIGHIHMSLQQYADAADAYCKILELDSANLGALMQLGLIYIRLSDTKKARSYFEQAAQINPDNPMVKNYLMKLQGEAKAEIRPMAGPREDVRLRGEPQVDELFAQLHTRVKKELTPRPGQLVDEVDPVGVGWSRFYEGIKKGKSLKQRARCFLGAAQMARIANDPHLFVLATAQYCAGRGYFEFRFRGDHQAARHVYYRTFVRLIKYLAAIPRSMSVSYRNAINAYLYSCLGTVQMPGHLSSDQLIGAVLEDKRGAEVLEEEIAFLIEENPALLIEIANWLNVHKATFVEKCVGIIQKLIASKSYNAFSALLRLDRDVSYFDAVIQRLRPKEAIHLAQALMDFGDPSMTSKAVRKPLPRFIDRIGATKWDQKTKQQFAFEVICYRRSDAASSGLEGLRTSLLRTILELEKLPDEELFVQKMQDIGQLLQKLGTAQTPQDKFLYAQQAEVEIGKGFFYARRLRRPQAARSQALLTRVRKFVQASIVDISRYPDVKLELTTLRLPYSEEVSVHFNVSNIGFGPAEDVRMTISETEDFITSQVPQTISVLSAGGETTWEAKIRPLTAPGEFTLKTKVVWCNVQGQQDSKLFEFVATFYPEEEFRTIPQRYIPGKPIKDPAMFYGREGIIEEIVNNLKGLYQDNVLVLHGQRRVGKTSLLYNLEHHDLRGPYIPVFIDMQEISGSTTARLCSKLANSVLQKLRTKGIAIPISGPLSSAYFKEDPLGKLGEFFDQIEMLEDIRVLLLIDEFEALMRSIREGMITEHFYNFLRGLMQHKKNLSFIFAGADELQEMMRDYASIMFNIARFIPVGYLTPEEAEQLIRKPVAGFLEYDDAAVDKIKAATAGNPYYIQLICYSLVERMNKEKRNVATVVDVNEVIDELLQMGSSYFEHLWKRVQPLENILLACLAGLADPASDCWVPYTDLLNQMRQIEKRYGKELPLTEEGVLLRITKLLRDRGVIEERRREEEIDFRIRLDLFREWFKVYQPLERTVKEVWADA